jgi:hypothetical protein
MLFDLSQKLSLVSIKQEKFELPLHFLDYTFSEITDFINNLVKFIGDMVVKPF